MMWEQRDFQSEIHHFSFLRSWPTWHFLNMSSCHHFFRQFTTIPSCHPKEVCFSISSSPKRQMSTISPQQNFHLKRGGSQLYSPRPSLRHFFPRARSCLSSNFAFWTQGMLPWPKSQVVFRSRFFENKPTNCRNKTHEKGWRLVGLTWFWSFSLWKEVLVG